jgi:hypothetical protein
MIGVDWNAIRPLDGSQQKGFEELCTQLADLEKPTGSRFIPKGIPDGGVECYAILSNGHEWGWQAKFFHTLGKSQWSQIDESINTALETHPQIVRYFVCVPLKLADGRKGKKYSKDQWDDHVQKWTGWATERGMAVEFIYWGSSELIDRISRPDFVSKLRFWFDARAFDTPWFTARLEEAVHAAGARYTPEIHVDLPIATEFEAFGRTERFFNGLKSQAKEIRENLQNFKGYDFKTVEPKERTAFVSKVQEILTDLGSIELLPVGTLPFQQIINKINAVENTSEEIERLLLKQEKHHKAKPLGIPTDCRLPIYKSNPFREHRYQLIRLTSELRKTRESLVHANAIANSNLLLLNGKAGTGKTHLLCDVTRLRISENKPTVLLMGQRFVSADEPWTQVLQQLDLANISTEDFVGALEAAAQTANCRALVIIDAINEGAGRLIWPNHLAAFLASLERSPWIGIVLSVRSSYEEIIVPDEIRSRAISLTHYGFAEHEYDAMRTFFVHFGIELPSTPLLAPEFRNPLFLKTLCRGLQEKGESRIPRGFHGITAVFELYIQATNKTLASSLGFNPKIPLIRQALEIFSNELINSGESWLPLARADEIVNALLPGREFEHSIYRGLVSEGMFIEEIVKRNDSAAEEVVSIGYERFADHLIAKKILDTHFNTADPASVFTNDGPLSYLSDEKHYVSPGLLEAFCIQIPERTDKELITLAPQIIAARWSIGDAFRQSIVWRATTSFSKETLKSMNAIDKHDHRWQDTLDTLLTVATLPGHPLNANFLNRHLRKYSMPDRDASWSIYLHDAWGSRGSVDRLVDWGTAIKPATRIDDESIDLCSTTLAWMLTTSNRFLRDHATKALVSLLTGQLNAVVRLIERFADVDDPYVAERVYAVAYGTAMRSHDALEVGKLAECIYDRIFVTGEPPAHILLRDYARGIVERAIYLGSNIKIDPALIRPPYKSTWPKIPTEEEIKPLLPDWSEGSYDDRDLVWARNRIGSSVMSDDFARYVLGTNSSMGSNHWLSVRLEDPLWQSSDERIAALVSDLSEDEKHAWESFNIADQKVKNWYTSKRYDQILEKIAREESGEDGEIAEDKYPEIIQLEQERDKTLSSLRLALTEDHSRTLDQIFEDLHSETDPPRFDISQIQRYILWRVFDLGWTTERFGQFDRFSIGYHGRDAHKAERIGKKYQWIAYHEIIARISDNFQYHEQYGREECDRAYCGPWQINVRDIDPSCTLKTTCGGTSWEGHSRGWWAPEEFNNWGDLGRSHDWVIQTDDLPNIEHLLNFLRTSDGSRWHNVHGYFNWRQPVPADHDSHDVERRELWYIINTYLIQTEDVAAFKKWAKDVDFWGRWMPESPEYYEMFLGEYGWSPAAQYFQQQYCRDHGDDGLVQPNHDCPVKLKLITLKYLSESGGFDCSVDETFSLRLPIFNIVKLVGLKWSGDAADYFDQEGNLAVFDPTAHENGPTALLFREDLFREFLAREKLTVCWSVIGEKRVIGAGFSPRDQEALHISGAYVLDENGPVGFLKYKPEEKYVEQNHAAGF